jgi:hypothetical protein
VKKELYMKCLTRQEMEKMIEDAFNEGKLWAETYVSWFKPTKEDHEERLKAINEIILKSVGEV